MKKMTDDSYWLYESKYYNFKFKIYSFSNEYSMKYLKEDEKKNDGNLLIFLSNEKDSLNSLKKYQNDIILKPTVLLFDTSDLKYQRNSVFFKKKADELVVLYLEISLKKDVKVRESLAELFLKIMK